MKKFAIVILSLTAALSAAAQTKTVTNQDLEKFRQQRLESERKLKEKYAEMGTTPEEVERQYRQRRAEMEAYSDQLRLWRIMAENEAIAQANASRQYDNFDEQAGIVYFSGYGSVPYAVYAPYGWRRNRSVLSQLRNLPPNMRTVQEYAIMYPNTRSVFNAPIRNVRRNGRFGKFSFRRGFGRRGF